MLPVATGVVAAWVSMIMLAAAVAAVRMPLVGASGVLTEIMRVDLCGAVTLPPGPTRAMARATVQSPPESSVTVASIAFKTNTFRVHSLC